MCRSINFDYLHLMLVLFYLNSSLSRVGFVTLLKYGSFYGVRLKTGAFSCYLDVFHYRVWWGGGGFWEYYIRWIL